MTTMTGALTLGGVPTLANLIGVTGSDSLLRTINTDMNNNDFFGGINDLLAGARAKFVENIVRPIQMIGDTVRHITGMLDYDEKFIPITDADLLLKIPACMHDCILQYAPVKKLFDEGRIFGFGHSYVPDGDPFGRLIKNGTVEDVLEAIDDNGDVEFEYEFSSLDPDLSFAELESIEESRKYIDWVLENTDIDFTDPVPNVRG